jgi:hypothetical protein
MEGLFALDVNFYVTAVIRLIRAGRENEISEARNSILPTGQQIKQLKQG